MALEPCPPPDDLFDYRGIVGTDADAPPLWLPHQQGDVFEGVTLPGVDQEERELAMLFQHPCTMRAGAVLKPRVVMIRVSRVSSKVRVDGYWDRRFALIPLPDLLLTGESYAGELLEVATVDSTALDRGKRVASLTSLGRHIFQQRVIHYLTRFEPSLRELAEVTANVEAEILLQSEWVERACDYADPSLTVPDVISQAEVDFDSFMLLDDRRVRLQNVVDQHVVHSEVHREIGTRYGAPVA